RKSTDTVLPWCVGLTCSDALRASDGGQSGLGRGVLHRGAPSGEGTFRDSGRYFRPWFPDPGAVSEEHRARHVMLPRELSKQVPKTHLMSEEEWRRLGVQQSLGWVHYMIHEPEPHILLFRRPLPKEQQK
uniref:Cyclin-dependent kinases regulatory subunit n=1 Tax=Lynx canadensis TaxID=61383 RepID=A0A667HG39_LYNCA